MSVLSDDFATVDVREELCYHSRPKEAKFKRGKNRIGHKNYMTNNKENKRQKTTTCIYRGARRALTGLSESHAKVIRNDAAFLRQKYAGKPAENGGKEQGKKECKTEGKKAVRGGKSGSRSQAVQRGRLRTAALSPP